MRQVLICCDACTKVVPENSIKDWWGVNTVGGTSPSVTFAPLLRNTEKFKVHACSNRCLQKITKERSMAVDMKKVSAKKVSAKKIVKVDRDSLSSPFSLLFGTPLHDDSSPHDGLGYYGISKKESEEEDQ